MSLIALQCTPRRANRLGRGLQNDLVSDGNVCGVLDANLGPSHVAACQLGRISAPRRMRVQDLALHQEGIGVEHDVVSGADSVMNEGPWADRASIAEPDVVGLEHAFLERMWLQATALVQIGVIADLDQRAITEHLAAIEQLGTDLHAHGAKQHAAERGAGEHGLDLGIRQLPGPFVPPGIRIVDRGELRLESLEAQAGAFEHDEGGHVGGGDCQGACEEREDAEMIVARECGLPEHERGKHRHPAAGEEDQGRDEIVHVLPAQPGATRLLVERRVHVAIAVDHARNLEGRRAEQPDVLAHRAVDRDHGLGAEQDVVSGSTVRRVADVVAQKVVVADLRLGKPERRRRHLHVDHRQPVRNHRAAADIGEKRVAVTLAAAHVRAGLIDRVQVPANVAHVRRDE